MELGSQATSLRIFIGESDKAGHVPMYEAIVRAARNRGMAGATVTRGLLSFGRTSRIRSAKLLDLSADLPIMVEIVDRDDRIEPFMPELDELFAKAGCGGLVTLEKVGIRRYSHGAHSPE